MTNTSNTHKTRWHRFLGTMLKTLLSPVGILVQFDFKIMTEPPEADILLIRREGPTWTTEQLLRLPDGIRDSSARQILLEFKYTESINEAAFRQTLGYDTFYKRANELTDAEVQTVLMSAKTPRSGTLTEFGYENTKLDGVYRSQNPLLKTIPLISLNELSNEPHNAFVKCFASRKKEKLKAFEQLREANSLMTHQLEWFLTGLWKYWFSKKLGEDEMTIELTPEEITEMGKMWGNSYLSTLKAEDVLPYFESTLKVEDVLPYFKPQEILAHFQPKDILSEMDHQQLLEALSTEEIEAYLNQKKKNSKQ
jgi:hypothetical protein